MSVTEQKQATDATTNTRIVHLVMEDNLDVALCGARTNGPVLDADGPIDCVVCAELVQDVIGKAWPW